MFKMTRRSLLGRSIKLALASLASFNKTAEATIAFWRKRSGIPSLFKLSQFYVRAAVLQSSTTVLKTSQVYVKTAVIPPSTELKISQVYVKVAVKP